MSPHYVGSCNVVLLVLLGNHGDSHGKHNVEDWNRAGAWAYGVVLETEVATSPVFKLTMLTSV